MLAFHRNFMHLVLELVTIFNCGILLKAVLIAKDVSASGSNPRELQLHLPFDLLFFCAHLPNHLPIGFGAIDDVAYSLSLRQDASRAFRIVYCFDKILSRKSVSFVLRVSVITEPVRIEVNHLARRLAQ